LDVTRIESQSLKLNKEELDLNDVISSVVGDYTTILLDYKDKTNLNIEYADINISTFVLSAIF
jgi:hypothetical protein